MIVKLKTLVKMSEKIKNRPILQDLLVKNERMYWTDANYLVVTEFKTSLKQPHLINLINYSVQLDTSLYPNLESLLVGFESCEIEKRIVQDKVVNLIVGTNFYFDEEHINTIKSMVNLKHLDFSKIEYRTGTCKLTLDDTSYIIFVLKRLRD